MENGVKGNKYERKRKKGSKEEKYSSTSSKTLCRMSNSNFPHTEDFRAKEKESDNDIKHVEAQSVTHRTNHQETQQRPTKVVAQ